MIKYEDNYYLKYVKDVNHSGVVYIGVRHPESEVDLILLVKVTDNEFHIKELSNIARITHSNKQIERGNLSSDLMARLDNAINTISNINKALEPPRKIHKSKHHSKYDDDLTF